MNHQFAFKSGQSHINGIEGFWSFAKDWHRQTHGVDPDNFPTSANTSSASTTATTTSSISFTASLSALN